MKEEREGGREGGRKRAYLPILVQELQPSCPALTLIDVKMR